MAKGLYSFYWDCGRSGFLDGLFIAEQSVMNDSIGEEVYFGEVLGKHSEVYGTLDKTDIKLVSDDQDFISRLEQAFGEEYKNYTGYTLSGYNPLNYLATDDEDEE